MSTRRDSEPQVSPTLAGQFAASARAFEERSRGWHDYVRGQVAAQVRSQDEALAVELVTEAAGRLRVDPLLRSRAELAARVLELDDQTLRVSELGRVDPVKYGRMTRGERLLVAAVTLLVVEKMDPARWSTQPARPAPEPFR